MKSPVRDRARVAARQLCARLGAGAAWFRAKRGAKATRGPVRRFWSMIAWEAREIERVQARPDTATRMWLAAEEGPRRRGDGDRGV